MNGNARVAILGVVVLTPLVIVSSICLWRIYNEGQDDIPWIATEGVVTKIIEKDHTERMTVGRKWRRRSEHRQARSRITEYTYRDKHGYKYIGKYSIAQPVGDDWQEGKVRVLDNQKTSTGITIYYNPKKPHESRIGETRGTEPYFILSVILVSVFALLDALAIRYLYHVMRRRGPPPNSSNGELVSI